MEKRKAKRIYREFTPAQRKKWQEDCKKIEAELPDLLARNQRHHDALKEKSLSGELRRAIQNFHLSPRTIAEKAGITWIELDDFLTGDKPLPSDVVDRLAALLKLRLSAPKRIASKPRTAKAS